VTPPAEIMLIAEGTAAVPDIFVYDMIRERRSVFAHPAGKVGSFIFYDGYAKSEKTLRTQWHYRCPAAHRGQLKVRSH
jgi:hypothetical protein